MHAYFKKLFHQERSRNFDIFFSKRIQVFVLPKKNWKEEEKPFLAVFSCLMSLPFEQYWAEYSFSLLLFLLSPLLYLAPCPKLANNDWLVDMINTKDIITWLSTWIIHAGVSQRAQNMNYLSHITVISDATQQQSLETRDITMTI